MFDPNQYAPSTGVGGQLPQSGPEGHVVVITGAELKPTQSGAGSYLQFNLKVVEGQSQGAEGAVRLNMINQSEVATKIAFADLTAICWSTGMMQQFDWSQDCSCLFNLMFRVVVMPAKKKEDADKGYTEVVKFMSYDGQTPAQGKPHPQARPAGQAQQGNPMGNQQMNNQMTQPQQTQLYQGQAGQNYQPPQQQQQNAGQQFQYPQGQQGQQNQQQPGQPANQQQFNNPMQQQQQQQNGAGWRQ